MKNILAIILLFITLSSHSKSVIHKKNNDNNTKYRYLGIGFPKALWPLGLPNLFAKQYLNSALDNMFNMNGYMNISLANELPIKNNLIFCNYLRFDMFYSNVLGSHAFYQNHGINSYPSINLINKSRRLKIGLGLSIIIANMKILNTNKTELFAPRTFLYTSPILHLKYDIVNKEKYKIALFSYIGYSFFNNKIYKNPPQFKEYRNSIIADDGFGNNFSLKNIFYNLIGINYEINY